MFLILGLGNPGMKYKHTRHNVGFRVVEALAPKTMWKEEKHFESQVARIEETDILLAKPGTFMNRSGEAVGAITSFYHIPLSRIIVVHDDADLSFGKIRLQSGRSSAGHKGVQSIMDVLHTNEFSRLRVGIGRPEDGKTELETFVLERLTKEEEKKLTGILAEAKEKLLQHVNKRDA
jgi:PTH1 family peptidyl-tRNA hydrolase